MPFRCSDYQSRFSWQLADETPVADVCMIGGVPYAVCCPLCSCWHELPISSARDGAIVSPRCLLREFAAGQYSRGATAGWQTLYQAWLERYPEAAAHTAIRVKLTTITELMARPAVKLVKKRKAAAPKNGASKEPIKPARTRKAKAA